jgi:hypothetical protein
MYGSPTEPRPAQVDFSFSIPVTRAWTAAASVLRSNSQTCRIGVREKLAIFKNEEEKLVEVKNTCLDCIIELQAMVDELAYKGQERKDKTFPDGPRDRPCEYHDYSYISG